MYFSHPQFCGGNLFRGSSAICCCTCKCILRGFKLVASVERNSGLEVGGDGGGQVRILCCYAQINIGGSAQIAIASSGAGSTGKRCRAIGGRRPRFYKVKICLDCGKRVVSFVHLDASEFQPCLVALGAGRGCRNHLPQNLFCIIDPVKLRIRARKQVGGFGVGLFRDTKIFGQCVHGWLVLPIVVVHPSALQVAYCFATVK